MEGGGSRGMKRGSEEEGNSSIGTACVVFITNSSLKNTCLALLLPKKTRNPWARVLYARSVSYEPCCLDASSYSASASL